MPLFSRGRSKSEPDPEVELLREALVFTLGKLAERGEPAEMERIERVLERLGTPPAPSGLVGHLERVIQPPRPQAGARDGLLAEAAATALMELANTSLQASLLAPRLEEELARLRDSIPPRVGVGDARRLERAAVKVGEQAAPLRRRAVEERQEMLAMVSALGEELSRLSGKGESLGHELRSVLRVLARDLDPERVRSARDELLQRMGDLSRSTTELQADLVAARQHAAELEDRLASKEAELSSLRTQATRDPLTDLCNRRSFDEALEESVKHARALRSPLCLVLVDIDHFKGVNDTWGHPAGDAVLQALARAVTEQVREADLPARVGGEELAVILPGAPLAVGRSVAERIRQAAAEMRVEVPGRQIAITLSAGVAACGPRDTPISLYKRADEALYAAKEGGRDRVEVAD